MWRKRVSQVEGEDESGGGRREAQSSSFQIVTLKS